MSKRNISPIESSTVRLRLLGNQDLQNTLSWRNQADIRKWFFYSEVVQEEQHLDWFKQYEARDDDFVFIIEDVAAGCRPVGQIAIYHIDWQGRRAEYGRVMIGEREAQGKGLAKEATRLVLACAFSQLALEEVYLEVFANNERAISLYRACGFEEVGMNGTVLSMHITRKMWTFFNR